MNPKKTVKVILIFLFVSSFFWSFFYEPGTLKVRKEIFSWKSEPLRIALFADLHAGSPFIDLKYVDRIVESLNEQNPDLVLIAGDLVITEVIGGRPLPIDEVIKKISTLKNKYGIYAVLGNHDWWGNVEEIRGSLLKNGIHVLENESVLLSFGTHSKVNLIGVGDDFTGHANLESAFANLKNKFPRIVFTHDPGILLDAKNPFDLALAGHMHGGQVNFPLIGPLVTFGRAPKAWSHGWTETKHGKLFVTKGIGTSILPVRFNAPPEVVLLDLK